ITITLPIQEQRGLTISLEADEWAVGLITSLVPHGTLGGRRQQVKVTHERSGASAVDRIRAQARAAQGREAGAETALQDTAADTGGARGGARRSHQRGDAI